MDFKQKKKKIPLDFESVSSLQEHLQKHLHLQKPGKVNDRQGIRKTVQLEYRKVRIESTYLYEYCTKIKILENFYAQRNEKINA